MEAGEEDPLRSIAVGVADPRYNALTVDRFYTFTYSIPMCAKMFRPNYPRRCCSFSRDRMLGVPISAVRETVQPHFELPSPARAGVCKWLMDPTPTDIPSGLRRKCVRQ